MSKFSNRIAKLEQGSAGDLGQLVFTKMNDGRFLLWHEGSAPDYRYCINGEPTEHTNPADYYTQAQLTELERKGHLILTVEYVENWRANDLQGAAEDMTA